MTKFNHRTVVICILCFVQCFVFVRSQIQFELETIHTCCDLNKLGFGQDTCPENDEASQPKIVNKNDNSEIWNVQSDYTTSGKDIQFKFVTKPLKCKNSKMISKVYHLGDEVENVKIMPDGYLSVGSYKRETVNYLHKDQYCINGKIQGNTVKINFCKPTCTKSEPCVRKCCPLDHIFDPLNKCVPLTGSNRWTPKLFSKPSNPESYMKKQEVGKIRISTNYVPTWHTICKDGIVLTHTYSQKIIDEMLKSSNEEIKALAEEKTFTPYNFRFGLDGKLKYRDTWRNWVTMNDGVYCVDGFTGASSDPAEFNNTIDEDLFIVCQMSLPEEGERQASEYYAAFAITTSMFALLTVIAYFLLIDKQNIHGWTTMSHSMSVFLLFIFLGIAHLTKDLVFLQETVGCEIIATVAHYFFIATFSWLLLISFDLWCTFRSISVATKRSGVKRFCCYSVFGWGFPVLVVSLSWIMQFIYGKDENTEIKVPDYGKSFCYISRFALWEYLYGPIAILLVLNIIFFLWTAIKLYQYQQSTKMAKQNLKKNKQSFLLFVKLFFVVGLLWIIEILSFSISGAHISIFWQILDTLNVLQPVFIFIIFVFKWEVINPIHEKYPVLRPIVFPLREALKRFRKSTKSTVPTLNSESTGISSTVSTRANNHHEASYAKVTSEAVEEIPLQTKEISD